MLCKPYKLFMLCKTYVRYDKIAKNSNFKAF